MRSGHTKLLQGHPDHRKHITLSEVAPYLPGGSPQCPAGGVYELRVADMQPTCSIHGSNAYLIDDDREETGMGWVLATGLCAAGTLLSARLLLWNGPRQGTTTNEELLPIGLQPSDSRRQ